MGREASSMRCPHCDGQDCIQIEIHLQTEDTVQFYSCRRCETKWWVREGGGEITLDEVLSLASQKTK
jgi:Zn ribbon nucleic-acid-binding protein